MNELRFPPNSQALSAYRASSAEFRKLKDPEARLQSRRALLRARRQVVSAFAQATLRRALSPEMEAEEEMVWFWFNHFNVYWQKDLVGAALPDYLDVVIRPRIRGPFRDLLLAVMQHPAMLVYLDNSRNVVGRINENFARELLELHTLGVDGGYSQADVQEVARVLTGFGLKPLHAVRWTGKQSPQVHEQGEFLFDPRHHDFGEKRVLGSSIAGTGFSELGILADRLSRHPATARYLAGKLCRYLAGDATTPELAAKVAQVFQETDGDLARVVAAIRQTQAVAPPGRPRTFKDPYKWLISAVGLLAASRPVINTQPVERWLVALGEPLFGRTTPDGYSLRGADWVGAGQLTQRFELAGELVNVAPRLLGQPLDAEAVFASQPVQTLLGSLGPATHMVLDKAATEREKLALLLSSPEFMYW